MEAQYIKENTLYEATFLNGDKCMVSLANVKQYPATGMSPDYMFKCYSPAFRLLVLSPFGGGFAIPEALVGKIVFREIKDSVILQLYTIDESELKFRLEIETI